MVKSVNTVVESVNNMVESVNTVVNSNCFVMELQRLTADACTLHFCTKLHSKT